MQVQDAYTSHTGVPYAMTTMKQLTPPPPSMTIKPTRHLNSIGPNTSHNGVDVAAAAP